MPFPFFSVNVNDTFPRSYLVLLAFRLTPATLPLIIFESFRKSLPPESESSCPSSATKSVSLVPPGLVFWNPKTAFKPSVLPSNLSVETFTPPSSPWIPTTSCSFPNFRTTSRLPTSRSSSQPAATSLTFTPPNSSVPPKFWRSCTRPVLTLTILCLIRVP